jgi:hypothetical protein
MPTRRAASTQPTKIALCVSSPNSWFTKKSQSPGWMSLGLAYVPCSRLPWNVSCECPPARW